MNAKTISVSVMTHHQRYGFFTRILESIQAIPIANDQVSTIKNTFSACTEEYDLALKVPVRDILTKQINAQNYDRLNKLKGIKNLLLTKMKDLDKDISHLAEKAYIIVETYYYPTRSSYTETTSKIENFLTDIKKLTDKEMKTLTLDSWIPLLDVSHETFKELVEERNREKTPVPKGYSTKIAAKASNAYRMFIQSLNLIAFTSSTEESGITTIIQLINQIIDEENQVIKLRQTLAKKKRENKDQREEEENKALPPHPNE